MSQFFAWGGQSIGVSAPASLLTANQKDNKTHDFNIRVLYVNQRLDNGEGLNNDWPFSTGCTSTRVHCLSVHKDKMSPPVW